MKKYIIGGITLIILLALAGGGYYYYAFMKKGPKKEHYKRDPNAWEVPVTAYSMKGKSFSVPDMPEKKVVLDQFMSVTTRDYPMGAFTIGSTSAKGSLTALDFFATNADGGKRAVPIEVRMGDTSDLFYLAIINDDGTKFEHTNSLLLGDHLKISKVTRDGDSVTVQYFVHGQNQPLIEDPEIETAAIINISTATFTQEGRKPWVEASLATRQLVGKYIWQNTVKPDGTKVVPSKPDTFTLQFDGPRANLGTDCNSGTSELGLPTGTTTKLTFGPVAATKMFCTSSEEGPYFEMFGQVASFVESTSTLTLKFKDKGQMSFVKEGQKLQFESTTSSSTRN
jgi:heat shock protein HslJ